MTNYSFYSSNVLVIDTASNMVIATIRVGLENGVAITPDGTRAFVTNWVTDDVSVIDTGTNTVIATVPVGATGPIAIAITPDGTRAYVTIRDSNTHLGRRHNHQHGRQHPIYSLSHGDSHRACPDADSYSNANSDADADAASGTTDEQRPV